MTAALYRTDFPNQCRTHLIDGMVLVFHRPSGATHFLASPAPEILELLAEAPMDATELSRKLCDRLDVPLDDEVLTVVETRIAELVGTGLIQAI